MYKFKIKKSKNGQFVATFVASNGQTMFTSETYATKRAAQEAIASAQKNAAGATVVDESEPAAS
jgi:uncharacterized protein YegP (UPF0339 family)